MKRALVVAAAFVLAIGMLAGCGAETEPDSVKVLDEAIHEVERAIGGYAQIDPNGPADEVERATDRVTSAWSTVVDAAADVNDVDISGAQAAYETLIAAADEITGDMTAGEAFAAIEGHVDAFEVAVDEIHEALDAH